MLVSLALLVGVPAPTASAAGTGIAVSGLQTNARTTPLGVDGDAPVFSWKSGSQARGVVQSAYEVLVGTSQGGGDVWSSGKVDSSDQLDVRYDGPALASQTRYFWQVRVWSGSGEATDWSSPSWFETGILSAGEWTADWIGRSPGSELDRWTDYTAEVTFSITSYAVGIFLRAPNTNNGYMWQISGESGSPMFRPHTKVNGNFALLDSKDISASISQEALLSGTHKLTMKVDGATITTSIDDVEIDTRTDSTFTKGFIGFRQSMLGSGGAESATIKAVTVTAKTGDVLFGTDFSGSANPFSGGTLTEDGLLVERNVEALLLTKDSNEPLLRTEFTTEAGKTIAAARVYAAARGVYELQLNGDKVGDQFLAPGWTDYAKRIQYQTYDITGQVKDGVNAIGAEMGDGWWAGKVGMWGPGVYGNDVSLIAQLRIDYTDGTHQVVRTDDSWKSHFGPYVLADNIDGETYDANDEQPGWDASGYNDAGWTQVTTATSATAKLVPQPDEPVRVTGERPALTRTDPSNGTHIYDLGQNMVGVARMKISGTAGSTVKFRYAEELRQNGDFYVGNLRAAKVTDYYTFKDAGTLEYTPKFTQHGFRYIEISGTSSAPELADVTGVVWGSDLAATGTLQTSDDMLNKLVSNISWGQRGNFLSVPTDTPARDERLGWTGDINVFSPTASYLRDTRAFLGKWLTDLRDSAMDSGDFPGVAPLPPGINLGGNVGWADSMITVPYAVWHAQGDTSVVRENYAAMKKFLAFVQNGAGTDLIDSARSGYNDWLNLDDDTPAAVLGTAYYAEDARMLSEMARAIGEDGDADTYAALSDQVRAAFAEAFVASDGAISSNSQTAYAMALGMKLVPDESREKVGAKFVAKLKTSDNHLTTGFLGTPWLLPSLTSIGESDLAYEMLLLKSYPSWGYEIEHGATTMWERWNSIKPDGSFGDEGMNSFNHYAYGAVGDWMYQNIGGISALTAGYKQSRIAPVVGGGLTSGHGSYESVYGTISSDWKKVGDDLLLTIEVPVNTTSQVSVPATNLWAVTEGGKPLSEAEGVSAATLADGVVTFAVGSGSYEIKVDAKNGVLGAILDEIKKTDDHAGALATAGELAVADRAHVGESLAVATTEVEAALAGADVTQHLAAGLEAVRALKAWLVDSTINGPTKGELAERVQAIEVLFGEGVASDLSVSLVLAPVAAATRPGAVVGGTVEISNRGVVALTGLEAVVTVDGWGIDSVTVAQASLGAGESVQLPFTVKVPARQAPGTYDASVELSYTSPYGTFTLGDTTPWVSVSSGVEILEVTSSHPVAGSEERATLTATVSNTGASEVFGQITAALPDGWTSPPASERVAIAAGATKDITVPLFVSNETVAGDVPVTVEFVDQAVTLASTDATLAVTLATPPTQTALDYVDFGDSASETAHGVQAAPNSGTNTEAGLTRRYAHTNYPGSWYSVEMAVTPGEPFLLRNRETFDGAKTKKYNIYVDDTLVKTYELKRAEGGQGAITYQTVIDDPAVLDNDGTVQIKYEFPLDAAGYYDPSIADSWVLPVTADALAPLVSASVKSSGLPGENGWYRGDAVVAIAAVDNNDSAPTVETGEAAGWQPYVAPIAISGEGKHSLSYRAEDSAGNSTGEKKVSIWIDVTAPSTQLSITRGSGVENSDTAALALAAQDELSGVASITYRIDGGEWAVLGSEEPAVTGYGAHGVEFFATDVAGNPEAVRSVVVDLVDVAGIAVVVAPQITGAAVHGAVLTATTGSWNTKGLAFAYQWLREGRPIQGAISATRTLTKYDLGHRLSVQVTASKAGLLPVSSTSASTAKVAKKKAAVSVGYSASKVKKGRTVRLSIAVAAATGTPRGTVRVYENGRKVKTLTLSSSGKVAYSLKLARKGLRSIKVTYGGSSTVDSARSTTRKVRVR